MEVVASFSQGRTAAAQCGLFTYKSVPVIFEPPCTFYLSTISLIGVRITIEAKDFVLSKKSRQALGPIQPPIQVVPGFFPASKVAEV